MDLRVQKTKNAITNAFLELRAVKPLNKISITELSKKAVISKATFYLHYKDVYDLSEQLQNELISDIIKAIPHPEMMIAEPQRYTSNMLMAFLSKQALIDILFSHSENNTLPNRIEYYIKDAVYTHYPQLKDNIKVDMALTYMIQGGFYAYAHFAKGNFREVQNFISSISKIVVDNALPNSVTE